MEHLVPLSQACCRECKNSYCKAWRDVNKNRVKETQAAHRQKLRGILNEIKTTSGCVDCGYNTHPEALQFDHVRGKKLFNISDIATSLENLLLEIEKCDVVCAICHAIRTATRREALAVQNVGNANQCVPAIGNPMPLYDKTMSQGEILE